RKHRPACPVQARSSTLHNDRYYSRTPLFPVRRDCVCPRLHQFESPFLSDIQLHPFFSGILQSSIPDPFFQVRYCLHMSSLYPQINISLFPIPWQPPPMNVIYLHYTTLNSSVNQNTFISSSYLKAFTIRYSPLSGFKA